jgi:hypothetical protein
MTCQSTGGGDDAKTKQRERYEVDGDLVTRKAMTSTMLADAKYPVVTLKGEIFI